MDCLAIVSRVVPGFQDKHGANARERRTGAVDHLPLAALDLDLYQIDPIEVVLGGECDEAAQYHLQGFLCGAGSDAGGPGVYTDRVTPRGRSFHSAFNGRRSPVSVARTMPSRLRNRVPI